MAESKKERRYVFPINSKGEILLGIRNDGFTPNPFGGGVSGSQFSIDTLSKECKEESHGQLILSKAHNPQQIYRIAPLTFYRADIKDMPLAPRSAEIAKTKGGKETTGEIFIFNPQPLLQKPRGDKNTVLEEMARQLAAYRGIDIHDEDEQRHIEAAYIKPIKAKLGTLATGDALTRTVDHVLTHPVDYKLVAPAVPSDEEASDEEQIQTPIENKKSAPGMAAATPTPTPSPPAVVLPEQPAEPSDSSKSEAKDGHTRPNDNESAEFKISKRHKAEDKAGDKSQINDAASPPQAYSPSRLVRKKVEQQQAAEKEKETPKNEGNPSGPS